MNNPRRDNPLVQLTVLRFREFWREPEALLWAFAFPLVLALGLGVAFRNRAPDGLKLADASPVLIAALTSENPLDVTIYTPESGEKAFLTGKIALLAEPGPSSQVIYRY